MLNYNIGLFANVHIKIGIIQEHTYFQELVGHLFLVPSCRWRHYVLEFVFRGGHRGGLLYAIGPGGQALVGWEEC